jgi:hypothetical protein
METTELTPEQEQQLQDYRRRLRWLILLSSGIDTLIFFVEAPLILPFMGGSLIIDEIVEHILSRLIAANRMRLKKRYRIAGLIPVPGVTALTLQSLVEMRKSRRHPEEILKALASPAEDPKLTQST